MSCAHAIRQQKIHTWSSGHNSMPTVLQKKGMGAMPCSPILCASNQASFFGPVVAHSRSTAIHSRMHCCGCAFYSVYSMFTGHTGYDRLQQTTSLSRRIQHMISFRPPPCSVDKKKTAAETVSSCSSLCHWLIPEIPLVPVSSLIYRRTSHTPEGR